MYYVKARFKNDFYDPLKRNLGALFEFTKSTCNTLSLYRHICWIATNAFKGHQTM